MRVSSSTLVLLLVSLHVFANVPRLLPMFPPRDGNPGEYDKARNLRYRTNSALIQTFNNNALNQVTNITRSGTLTVSGALGAPASAVTVNGLQAEQYADLTFARTNNSLTGSDSFTVIAQNQFRSVTNTLSTTLPASVTLTWDANGNLTSDGTRNFQYDPYNRLVTNWVVNSWKIEFLYGGLGRRRIMREYGWQGSGWGSPTNETRYVYDGMLPIQERNGTNAILASYTRGLDGSGTLDGAGGIGGLLARSGGGTSWFYHRDGIGNITSFMDTAGRIEGRYEYGPFGRLVGMWGSMAEVNPFTFSTKPRLPHAEDLFDFGFRQWSSTLQRWHSPDPLGESSDLNLYRGMMNSPLNVVDREGFDNMYRMDLGNNAPPAMEISAPIMPQGTLGPATTRFTGGDDAMQMMIFLLMQGNDLQSIIGQLQLIGTAIDGPKEERNSARRVLAIQAAALILAKKCPTAKKPALPDSYWINKKAPTQVDPGIRRITDMKPSARSQGEVYERTSHYDQFGRQTGQTHETAHGEPAVHPNPHYHTRNPVTGEVSDPLPGVHPDY